MRAVHSKNLLSPVLPKHGQPDSSSAADIDNARGGYEPAYNGDYRSRGAIQAFVGPGIEGVIVGCVAARWFRKPHLWFNPANRHFKIDAENSIAESLPQPAVGLTLRNLRPSAEHRAEAFDVGGLKCTSNPSAEKVGDCGQNEFPPKGQRNRRQ